MITDARPVPRIRRPILSLKNRSFMARTADILTLMGAAAAPNYGKGFGGINGKGKYADILLGLAMLFRIGQALTEGLPRYGLKRQQVLIWLLSAFAVAGLVGGMVNGQPLIWDYIRVVIATLGTVVLVSVYGDGKDLTPLLKAFALGTGVLALSSFTGPHLQGRAIGWSSHPNQLGHSCMMGLFAALWLVDRAQVRWQRWLWIFIVALDAIGVDRSGSRGALLGVGVGGLVYLWLRGDRRLRLAAVAVTWAAGLVLFAGLVVLPPSNPLARFVSSGGAHTSSGVSDQARVALLQSDWDKATNHPLFGIGWLGNDQIHGVYLQGWLGGGAIGALLIILVGLLMFIGPWGHRKRDVALLCGGFAVALAWAFTNLLTLRDQWIFITVMFSVAPPLSGLPGVRNRRADNEVIPPAQPPTAPDRLPMPKIDPSVV